MSILIIEDEQFVLNVTRRILEKNGFKVVTSLTGEQALEIFKKEPEKIKLVLLDHILPGLGGVETLTKIRKISPEMPCIYSSGHINQIQDFPERLKENTEFLVKPYRATTLIELVSKIAQD